MILPRIMLEQK